MTFPQKLLLSALAGLAVFAGLGYLLDWRAMVVALGSLRFEYLPAIVGLVLLNYLLRFLKWQYYLKVLGLAVPFKESLAIYLVGFMMAVTPGKLGEVLKAYLLKRMYGIKMRVTAPAVLADRLTDVTALLALSLAGATTLQYSERVLWAGAVAVVAGVLALSSRRLAELAIGLASKLPVLDRIAPKLHEAHASMASLIAPYPLALGTALSIPAWACEGIAFYLIFLGLEASVAPSLLASIFIYSFSTLVGALSMLPGGLGAAEAGLAGLAVKFFAVPKGVAAAATLLIRLLTLWFAVALGAVTFALCQRMFGIGFAEVGSVKKDD